MSSNTSRGLVRIRETDLFIDSVAFTKHISSSDHSSEEAVGRSRFASRQRLLEQHHGLVDGHELGQIGRVLLRGFEDKV